MANQEFQVHLSQKMIAIKIKLIIGFIINGKLLGGHAPWPPFPMSMLPIPVMR